MKYGPQDEPIPETLEERAALPQENSALLPTFGPQGEVIPPDDTDDDEEELLCA